MFRELPKKLGILFLVGLNDEDHGILGSIVGLFLFMESTQFSSDLRGDPACSQFTSIRYLNGALMCTVQHRLNGHGIYC